MCVAVGTVNPNDPIIGPTQQQVISYVIGTANVELAMGTLNSALAPDKFGQPWRGGVAAVLRSAMLGNLTIAPIFRSFATFNPADAHQVLSDVAPGGREVQIGFEDLPSATGDNDFQDVVIGIRVSLDDRLLL